MHSTTTQLATGSTHLLCCACNNYFGALLSSLVQDLKEAHMTHLNNFAQHFAAILFLYLPNT